MKVVGKQAVDYKSKKTGNPVTGVTLHCTVPNDRVNGLAVETIFISGKSEQYEAADKLPLGSEIIILYNRYGQVDDIRVTTTK